QPTVCRLHVREAARLRRAAERGGFGGPARGPPISLKQTGEEVLDRGTEGARAVLEAAPRALGFGFGGLARLLELLPGVLRAFGNGVADVLGGLLDPGPDPTVVHLYGVCLLLVGGVLPLGVVGG